MKPLTFGVLNEATRQPEDIDKDHLFAPLLLFPCSVTWRRWTALSFGSRLLKPIESVLNIGYSGLVRSLHIESNTGLVGGGRLPRPGDVALSQIMGNLIP